MSYQSEVLADTPWLYWRLDEVAGTTAADTSGNGRTGTYTLGPTLNQAGLVTEGTSVLFDGVNDYLLSAAAIFNSSTATVEVWFDYDGTPPAASNWWVIAGCIEGIGGTTAEKLIMIDQNGKAVFLVYDGSSKIAVGATTLTAGRHHLVGVINDPSNVATIYVDGVSDGTVAAGSSYTGYGAPNVMVSGFSGAGNYMRVVGRRDEFAIYTTALSAARILAHYNAGIATAPVNTVAPVASGTPTEGQTLSVTDGTWTGTTPITFTYQWQRDVAGNLVYGPIGGATNNTYLLVAADVGCNVRCAVTGTNVFSAVAANSNKLGPVASPPTPGGGPLHRSRLILDDGQTIVLRGR